MKSATSATPGRATPASMPPSIAFVMGTARSGTTAMAYLLNAHARICIGVERYKHLFNRTKRLDPALFSEQRFFSFDASDTNILPVLEPYKSTYEAMRPKWQQALVVGDKLGARALPAVLRDIADARVVYTLRQVDGVANSWNVRALRANDPWPRENDFSAAVPRWNAMNQLALRALEELGPRMLVVEYERFFAGDATQLWTLEAFLDVPRDEAMAQAYRASSEYYVGTVGGLFATVLEGQAELIAREADMDTYGALLGHARRQFGEARP